MTRISILIISLYFIVIGFYNLKNNAIVNPSKLNHKKITGRKEYDYITSMFKWMLMILLGFIVLIILIKNFFE